MCQVNFFQNLSPEDDGFFDLLTKFQSRRIDEQRCSLKSLNEQSSSDKENGENKPPKITQGTVNPIGGDQQKNSA